MTAPAKPPTNLRDYLDQLTPEQLAHELEVWGENLARTPKGNHR